MYKDKNVLITGATGILGSILTRKLLEENANITIILRDEVPKSNLVLSGDINKVNIVKGEIQNIDTTERAINEYEIDTIFHLGAQTIVQTANRSPLSTFESNIKGTWTILEAARNSRLVKRIIVASSDKAYGDHKTLPYNEEFPLQGKHPYDVSKSCTDLISQSYAKTYDMPITISRCGNIYGEGDLNFNRIIPGTIKSILHNQQPIIRSNGEFIRDYFYVKDTVEAYLKLGEHTEKFKGEAFNFSSGEILTVKQIVNKILELTNKQNLQPIIQNQASNEIIEQHLDSTKAKNLLGWKPKYTLEQGLKETIEWYKKFFNI